MEIVPTIILALVLFAREYVHRLEMREEAKQRAGLIKRIQAPREIAYKEFVEDLPPGAPSEPIASDDDYWALVNGAFSAQNQTGEYEGNVVPLYRRPEDVS